MTRKLWTFRVSGPEPFELRLKGNPVQRYDGGGETVLRGICTEAQAVSVVEEAKAQGIAVVANCPKETAGQAQERRNLLEVLGGDRPFPCPQCPSCAWFDPHIESLCGAGLAYGKPGWETEAVEGAMTSDRYRTDFETCPLREVSQADG